jgi:hypothetical protein
MGRSSVFLRGQIWGIVRDAQNIGKNFYHKKVKNG